MPCFVGREIHWRVRSLVFFEGGFMRAGGMVAEKSRRSAFYKVRPEGVLNS